MNHPIVPWISWSVLFFTLFFALSPSLVRADSPAVTPLLDEQAMSARIDQLLSAR